MMNLYKTIVCGVVLSLSGCVGGDGDPGNLPVSPRPPPPPRPPQSIAAAPGGLWFGTMKYDLAPAAHEVMALATDDGRLRVISLKSDVAMINHVVVDKTPFSVGGSFYAGTTDEQWAPSYNFEVNFWGEIIPRESLSMIWSSAWDTEGSLEFTIDTDLHEKNSHLDYLAGTWTGIEDDGSEWLAVTIAADGSFIAKDESGCMGSGRFALIDSSYNLYDVQEVRFDCDLSGNAHNGLAFLHDVEDVQDGALFLSIDNGREALRASIQRD